MNEKVRLGLKAMLLAELPVLRAFALSLAGTETAPTIWCRTL